MKWQQASDWHWARLCGRYTVSRSLSFAWPRYPHGIWLWDAWLKPTKDAAPEQLNTESLETREMAIAVCTEHLRQHATRQSAA